MAQQFQSGTERLIFSVELSGPIIVCVTTLYPTALSVLQIQGQILVVLMKPQLINNSTPQRGHMCVIRTKGSRTSYSKDHFNGPKYSEQLSVHSCKRKKKMRRYDKIHHI